MVRWLWDGLEWQHPMLHLAPKVWNNPVPFYRFAFLLEYLKENLRLVAGAGEILAGA